MSRLRRGGAILLSVTTLVALGTAMSPAALHTTPTADLEAPSRDLGAEVGTTFPTPPEHLEVAPRGEPDISQIRLHLAAGDTHRALRAAERFVAHRRWGRERDAAWMVIGMLHREAERHNLASEAFTKVRTGGGPLAPWGAFHEAEQDLLRGKEWVAIRECERYRETWPSGSHADACLRLIARAHASMGHVAAAREAAAAYDAAHDLGTISEQIELALATWEAEHEPERAVSRLRTLAVDHHAPLTGRVAEELLAELQAEGVAEAVLPDDTASLMQRAVSLRDAKRKDEAWAVYQELVERSTDDPKLARWVEDSAESFGWRTHRWDVLADWYGARYAASGRADDAWGRYRALGRGGRHAEAADLALEAQEKHAGTREWRRRHEEVGNTLLLAGRYDEAVAQFDQVAGRGGWTGRRGAFYAGFASFMAGELDDAVARLTAVVDKDRTHALAARYWRARAYTALEQEDLAQADRAAIVTEDPHSWYAVLARQHDPDLPRMAPFARDGSWVGPDCPPPHRPDALASLLSPDLPVASPLLPRPRDVVGDFSLMSWTAAPPREEELARYSLAERVDELEPPPSYLPGTFFDEDRARRALYALGEEVGASWPEVQVAHDLASVGLYDLSGPLLSGAYESWREAYRNPRDRRYRAARSSYRTGEQWRDLFLYARDHHHVARFTYGMWEDLEDPALKREAMKLGFPTAHDRYVWTHARDAGIDPYLVLGLMRQESTYNANAVSRVGARGAMQIMPRTGHLLADLAHDTTFTAGDLEDPVLSVGYGITYLGLLMERFEGVYPLAIASYNGGPFNVSAWMAEAAADVPIDAFVEQIPFRETRDYVKKVTAGYASYLALYAPEGTQITLPGEPRGDHPEIVDF